MELNRSKSLVEIATENILNNIDGVNDKNIIDKELREFEYAVCQYSWNAAIDSLLENLSNTSNINKENTIVYLGKDDFEERKNKVAELWGCDDDWENEVDDDYDCVYWINEMTTNDNYGFKKVLAKNCLDYDYLENIKKYLGKGMGFNYIISYKEFIRLFDY